MTQLVTGHGEAAAFGLAFALAELDIPFDISPLDLYNFAQWSPQHRAHSPDGRPVLLEMDGRPMDHPLLALLYLAESAPGAGLLPDDPADRYLIHATLAQLDRQMSGSLSYFGWSATTPEADRRDYLARLAAHPERPVLAGWSAVWRDAIVEDRRTDDAKARILQGLAQIAALLDGDEWLVSARFSVADIAAFALLRQVPGVVPEATGLDSGTALASWCARVAERPAARHASRKFTDTGLDRRFCPPVFV